ncbi:hypothetical protein [Treponema endosymbiont of Eucomonympha sp.]|uniref:hypothetical protein n=1 Tax=Treponema endosymbiont of Eucomonympha sp. TaxID=1580831 RepID=UPI000A58668C|nr:hypothetical protein [Treponema endosymbiont of Eucomonympha sp.]
MSLKLGWTEQPSAKHCMGYDRYLDFGEKRMNSFDSQFPNVIDTGRSFIEGAIIRLHVVSGKTSPGSFKWKVFTGPVAYWDFAATLIEGRFPLSKLTKRVPCDIYLPDPEGTAQRFAFFGAKVHWFIEAWDGTIHAWIDANRAV